MTTSSKGLGHGPATASGPRAEILPGWRAACAAYKREYAKNYNNHTKVMDAAEEALREALPHLSKEEASKQTCLAIHWASVEHNAWLYSRAQERG